MEQKTHSKDTKTPHVLIFPVPLQGHITPMLNLAELLCLANLKVTFLNTIFNQNRFSKCADIEARFARYPGLFKFKTVPDGLPDNHPRSGDKMWLAELFAALPSSVKPLLRDILLEGKDEYTCIILDGWMSYANEVVHELKLPVITFLTPGACFIWTIKCMSDLIEAGELPFKDEDMDKLVKNAPGLDSYLRYRDLPSQEKDISVCHKVRDMFSGEIQKAKQSRSLILNTFEDLEGPTLSLIREQCRSVYTIGPLHAHLKYRLDEKDTTLSQASCTNLWEVDRSCISWLDQKPDKSVVYASFGSTTVFTDDQLVEFWAGLVQSKRYFIWVIKSDIITGNDSLKHDDLVQGTKERGCIVSWAPQEEVLAHRAVGGFLNHSGWNSILESIIAGVPMLCWTYLGDHYVNRRYFCEVLGIGLEMQDKVERTIVKNMINDLMERKKDELGISITKLSQLAKKSFSEGGSSYTNLNHLIDEIKGMMINNKNENENGPLVDLIPPTMNGTTGH